MNSASRFLRSLVPLAGLLLLCGGPAGAQPCGTGTLHLYVLDSEGPAVENLTIEVLKPGGRERFEAYDTDGYALVAGFRLHVPDGKPVRYSGQALHNWDGPADPNELVTTFGPVKLVLDRVEPR